MSFFMKITTCFDYFQRFCSLKYMECILQSKHQSALYIPIAINYFHVINNSLDQDSKSQLIERVRKISNALRKHNYKHLNIGSV